MQRVSQWIWWLVFGIAAGAVALVLSGVLVWALLPKIPEEVAFTLSLVVFYLLAHRLLMGYGAAMSLLAVMDRPEEEAQRLAVARSGLWWEKVKEWTFLTVMWEWIGRLDAYKYAYYVGYFILVLFFVLTRLNVWGYVTWGPLIEAVFWGASIPTLFVVGFDWIAHWYLNYRSLEA